MIMQLDKNEGNFIYAFIQKLVSKTKKLEEKKHMGRAHHWMRTTEWTHISTSWRRYLPSTSLWEVILKKYWRVLFFIFTKY